MGKRKQRSRRHDPRSMTREEFVRERMKRYREGYLRHVRAYERKYGNSPYTAIERLRYP